MRILLDTNILLYAVNRDAPQHAKASAYVRRLLESGEPWCLAWATIYEFLAVASHPGYAPHPLSPPQAWETAQAFLDHPDLELLGETERHKDALASILEDIPSARGPFLYDCRLAALMREHDVRTIATADAEFRKFTFLKIVDPTKS